MRAVGPVGRLEKLIADGQSFLARGQYASARNRFRDAAKLAPGDPRGHFFLGTVLLAEKDAYGALPSLKAAAALMPDNVEIVANLGLALAENGDRAGALVSLERALALRPGDPGIKLNLANVLIDEKRQDEALGMLADAGDSCGVLLARAHALIELGRAAESLAAAGAAAALEPRSPDVLNAQLMSLQYAGRLREAIEMGRRLVEMGDPVGEAYLGIATNQARLGDIAGATRTLEAAIVAAGGEAAASPKLLQMRAIRHFYIDPEDTANVGRLHRAAGASLERVQAYDKFDNLRDKDRRLRLGFVSPDFRAHSVMSFLMGPLLELDRARLEVHLYASVDKPDAITARARELADGYRDIFKTPPAQIARTIRADGIDVLIDLAGHTAGNALEVFARRPAPVQMTWLGYPYTTGLKRIRWRLTDAIADPPDRPSDDYSERLLRLERFLCYRPRDEIAPARPRPAEGPPVFGSFNNLDKYDDRTIAHWVAILARIPDSRLIVRQPALRFEEVRTMWHRRFVDGGIAAERLDMGPFDDRLPDAQFSIHDEVDICLDPLGYNGTTTTCQALWMGVPVIVVPGRAHAACVGASIMTAASLPEFVARDPEDALERIAALAADRPRLAAYRATLRDTLRASPLCDAKGFARDFEAAIRKAWSEWCGSAG